MTIKMGLVENLMEETIDQIVGRIRETQNTETLAGITDIIKTIAATHQDKNNSIIDTVSPSTECLIIDIIIGATHRNSTGTQSTISTDTENKNRRTELPTLTGTISTGMCRMIIRGIRTFLFCIMSFIYKANSLGCISYWLPFVFKLLGLVKIFL